MPDFPQTPIAGQSPSPSASQDNTQTLTYYSGVLTRLVNFRRPFDVRRSLFYRQYIGQRDQRTFPDNVTPRSNSMATYPYSNVETIVSRTDDAFFGYEDWFECRGRGANDGDAADQMQIVMKYLLKQSLLTQAVEDLVRNIAIYGHAGIKVEWDHGYDLITIKQPVVNPQTNQPVMNPRTMKPLMQSQQVPVARNRPKFIPIDVFDLLVDPDGYFVGMMADKTLGQLIKEQEGYSQQYPDAPPLYLPEGMEKLKEALSGSKVPQDTVIRLAEIWDKTSNQYILMTAKDPEAIAWKDRRLSYRLASYSGYRMPVFAGEPILLYIGENDKNHKQCPILHTSYVRLPNEQFGIGAIEPISNHVENLSTFINMIVDNWNLGINRRYAYDINANIDHEALNRFSTPGGKVGVDGDPNKVISPLPFFTPEGGDYQLLEVYRNLIEMTSGISDFYSKGVGGPQGNETATGIGQVIGESNYKFRMFIRNLELYIIQPLLQQVASMIQQYITDDFEVMITDEPAGIPKAQMVSPQELIGNFSFDLVASNYVTNKTIRQRNLMAFVNIVGQSPFWNQYEGLKTLAKVFEIPNIKRLLKTPEQVQQEQQQNMMQQMQIQEMLAQNEQRRTNEQILLKGAVGVHQSGKEREAKAKEAKVSGGGHKSKSRAQFEGHIPGIGTTSPTRDIAQSMGANALGLEGMGAIGTGA